MRLGVSMADGAEAVVANAVSTVDGVKGVSAVSIGTGSSGRTTIGVRVDVQPGTSFREIGFLIARAQVAIGRVAPQGAVVFVEPAAASAPATPTEAIVIRGAE